MKRNIFKLDVAGSISVACAGLVKITKLHGCARQTPLAQQASVRKGPFAQKLICARYPRVHPAFILGNEKVTRGIGMLNWSLCSGSRSQTLAELSLKAAKEWGRSQGCAELASDTQPDNETSVAAHHALGVTDVGLIRCFRKDL
jgi:hypothetical protein